MNYKSEYKSPVGTLLITADDDALTGIWFKEKGKAPERGSRAETKNTKELTYAEAENFVEKETAPIKDTKKWLDIYFEGEEPEFMPEVHLDGTEFQIKVWEKLLEIPYGVTTTYGEIARELAADTKKSKPDAPNTKKSKSGSADSAPTKVSAQAVGGAVGSNPISIIIPCHRVIGSDGDLTGYGGGLKRKKALLQLEGAYDEI